MAYAALLVWLRPATPFEWDEVLYQRALDHYDVASHSPHPPGEPVFIAAGHVVRWAVRDPQLALQFVTIIFTVGGLVALFFLARRLGARDAAALAAVVICCAIPGFFFHGNVGLTDAPAAYGVVAASLAFLVAAERPGFLWVAALAAALALGIRPQDALALVPAGVVAVVAVVRRRAWRSLWLALATGILSCLAIWAPVVLLTGWSRYRRAVAWLAQWMLVHDGLANVPDVTVTDVVRYWLLNSLGSTETASVFWALVAAGAVVWWRHGRRMLVLLSLASALPYLAFSIYRLQMFNSVRYTLPAMAWLALLPAGVLVASGRWTRAAGTVALAGWVVAAVWWGLPAYLQRREPAPVWSVLTWVRDHCDPRGTIVVFHGVYQPHVMYVLGRAGFKTVPYDGDNLASAAPPSGGGTVIVAPAPIPGTTVLRREVWNAPRALQLAFGRYGECTAMRAPPTWASAPARALVVLPQAAHVVGVGNSQWSTDVSISNLLSRPLRLQAIFLPSSRDNLSAPSRVLRLGPHQHLEVRDVWSAPELLALAQTGAIVLRNLDDDGQGPPGPWLAAFTRTTDATAAAKDERGERLPAFPLGAALRAGGVARFPHLTHDDRFRTSVGLASLAAGPVTAHIRIVVAGGHIVGDVPLFVPIFGHKQLLLPQRFSDATVEVALDGEGADVAVFPCASQVDGITGIPSNRVPSGFDAASEGGIARVFLPTTSVPTPER